MNTIEILSNKVIVFNIAGVYLEIATREDTTNLWVMSIFRYRTNSFTQEQFTEYYEFIAGCSALENADIFIVLDYLNKIKNNTLSWPLNSVN